MEDSPSWEASNCSFSKVYYHVYMLLDTISIQMNRVTLWNLFHSYLPLYMWVSWMVKKDFALRHFCCFPRNVNIVTHMCNFYRWTISSSVFYTTQLVSHIKLWYPCDFQWIEKVTPVKNVELHNSATYVTKFLLI